LACLRLGACWYNSGRGWIDFSWKIFDFDLIPENRLRLLIKFLTRLVHVALQASDCNGFFLIMEPTKTELLWLIL